MAKFPPPFGLAYDGKMKSLEQAAQAKPVNKDLSKPVQTK